MDSPSMYNCDRSKMIAVEGYREEAEIKKYNMEQRRADATITTAGIHGQHTRPGAGVVDDQEGLHVQHQDEDHHCAAFMKEDHEPRIETILRITPKPDKTMYETHQKSVLNMTETPRTTALAHYNDEFAATNLAD